MPMFHSKYKVGFLSTGNFFLNLNICLDTLIHILIIYFKNLICAGEYGGQLKHTPAGSCLHSGL